MSVITPFTPMHESASILFPRELPPLMDAFLQRADGYGVALPAFNRAVMTVMHDDADDDFVSGRHIDQMAADVIRRSLPTPKLRDFFYGDFHYQMTVTKKAVAFDHAPLLTGMTRLCALNLQSVFDDAPDAFDPLRRALLGVFAFCQAGPWFLSGGVASIDELTSRFFQTHSRYFPPKVIDAESIDRDPAIAVMQLIAMFVDREAAQSTDKSDRAASLYEIAGNALKFDMLFSDFVDVDVDNPMSFYTAGQLLKCFRELPRFEWDAFRSNVHRRNWV